MLVKPEEITTLIELFDASDWDELHVQIDGLQLFLSTDPNARLATAGAQSAAAPAISVPAPSAAAAPSASATKAASVAIAPAQANWTAIPAPNLGTFYRAPKPGAAAFVELGQSVGPDTELCLIEVMKLFTAVKAGMAGIVRQICTKDGDMVEYGQTLFYIEPSS